MEEVKNNVEVKEELNSNKVDAWSEALENENWITPLINVTENDDDYVLNAYMPGVSKDSIKIKYDAGAIEILGRIDYEKEIQLNHVLREKEIGNYYRKLNLSDSIDEKKISANLVNGVLAITLPKHERVKPRNIEIN